MSEPDIVRNDGKIIMEGTVRMEPAMSIGGTKLWIEFFKLLNGYEGVARVTIEKLDNGED